MGSEEFRSRSLDEFERGDKHVPSPDVDERECPVCGYVTKVTVNTDPSYMTMVTRCMCSWKLRCLKCGKKLDDCDCGIERKWRKGGEKGDEMGSAEGARRRRSEAEESGDAAPGD